MNPDQNQPDVPSGNTPEDNLGSNQNAFHKKTIQPINPISTFKPAEATSESLAEVAPVAVPNITTSTPNTTEPVPVNSVSTPSQASAETTPPPAPATPPAQNPFSNSTGIVVGDGGSINTTNPPPTPRGGAFRNTFKTKRSKLIFAGVTSLVLIGGTLGVVFGYVLPNQPSRAYSSGLDRSGKALTKLTESLTEKETIEKFQKTELSGKLNIDSEFLKADGTFSSKFDSTKFDGSADLAYSFSKEPQQKITAKFLSEAKDKGQLPDSYLQVTGLAALEMGELSNAFKGIEGKWIGISSDYLKSLNAAETAKTDNRDVSFTYEDGTELVNAIVKPTNEFVFTSNTSKSVLVQKDFVGVEKIDDVTAYHYKMGLSKENSKKYCEALINSFYSTNVYKKFAGEEAMKNVEKDKKDAIDSCKKDADRDIKEEETFDMWIDKKYKLIYKFRITPDEKKTDEYVDIGQHYKGKDDVNFFVKYVAGSQGEANFTVETNTKTAVSKASFDAKGTGDFKFTANGSFESKPLTGELKIEKPANAVPVQEVLQQLGVSSDLLSYFILGGAGAGGSAITQSKAEDSERKTDINTVHAQLEAYYAQNGLYPTLSQISDPAFRKKNFPGLDDSALKAPGSQELLSSTATKDRYGYRAACPSGRVSECNEYVLTAILSDGQSYTKKSLN